MFHTVQKAFIRVHKVADMKVSYRRIKASKCEPLIRVELSPIAAREAIGIRCSINTFAGDRNCSKFFFSNQNDPEHQGSTLI